MPTNAEQVKEMCRLIRGMALNYPAGLQELRQQLDAVDPRVPLPQASEAVKRGPGRPRKVQA